MVVMGANGASDRGRQASPQRCRAVTQPQPDSWWIVVQRCVRSLQTNFLNRGGQKGGVLVDFNDLLGKGGLCQLL